MRRYALAGLLTVVLTATGCAHFGFRSFTPPSTVDVGVNVTCNGSDVGIVVDKWVVALEKGGVVRWNVQAPGASTTRIRRKGGRPWAFNPGEPDFDVTKGAAGGSQRNVINTKGRYGYDIVVRCERPGGGIVNLTIDPDIIIVESLAEVGGYLNQE